MKRSIVILPSLFFCLFGTTSAQDLHIYYDAETALIKYIYDGVEIKSPKIKKDGNIFLHVENYNNYIYSLDVVANNQSLQIPPGSGIGDLLPSGGFNGGAGGSLFNPNPGSGAGDGYINIDGGSGGGEDEDGGFGFATDVDESELAVFNVLNARYNSILDNMVQKEVAFVEVQEEVIEVEKAREFRSVGLSEIQKIKWNPNLSPEQVKRMSYEFLNKILEIEDKDELSLDYVIQKGDDRQQLLSSLGKLQKNSKEYEKTVADLNQFAEEIKTVNLSFEEFAAMKIKVAEIAESALDVQQNVETQKVAINEMVGSAGAEELKKMTSIWYEYEALSANDFSYTYRTEATGDRTVLGIKFTARDSLGNVMPINKKELAPIKVPVYGGMKINVSIGISFSQYFKRPQSYYLQDTIIRAENADGFVPVITSFFHFYPQSAGNVSIGGNFGVGIPLSSADFAQSLAFFLGPSFIIGKGQRVVLSTGVMGGKVEQLSQGLEEGDVLPQDSIVPTKTAYQLGYFLGISFNIGGG